MLSKNILIMALLNFSLLEAKECKHTEIVTKVSRKSLKEVSGMAISKKYRNVFWAHNDAGDGARFIAFNRKGQRLGKFKLKGATNRDYEDMSFGPCLKNAGDCLYIGDIGNNLLERKTLDIYEIPEPDPSKGSSKITNWTKHTFNLPKTYNAEALIFHPPSKNFYLFTKSHRLTWEKFPEDKGKSHVFRLNSQNRKVTLEGSFNTILFRKNRKKAQEKPRASFVTGAAISSVPNKIMVGTLKHGIEFNLKKGLNPFRPFPKTYNNKFRFPRFSGAQIEALTYSSDGKSIYVFSESKKVKSLYLFKVSCNEKISWKHIRYKIWEFFN
ncbi:MAG: hypothetical protein VYD54_10395 [Bdellovibrionota bacterium]|nr:hypothetical protein [Bdellovibrionota bacterium]